MARPIKETPILKGRDARNFEKRIKESATKKVPAADYQRAMAVYRSIKVE